MDHLASLIATAGTLRRRLWVASQTWSSRLDHLFSRLLTASEADPGWEKEAAANIGIAHGFAMMFLLGGVKGLPPIKGQDSAEWVAQWKAANPGPWHTQVTKLERAIPSSYGSELAGALWASAMKAAAGSAQNAEDLLQDIYVQFLSGLGEKIEQRNLPEALKYVKSMIEWRGKNRLHRLHKEKSLTQDDDEGGAVEREIVDERNLDTMMDEHNARAIVELIFKDPKLKSELESIHPDALQYLELSAQDYSDVEILGVNDRRQVVGEPKLKHPNLPNGERLYPSLWNFKKQKFFQVIKKHFQRDLHHASSYDYDRHSV